MFSPVPDCRAPKKICALMLLNGGQMKFESVASGTTELLQQVKVQLRIVLEPIVDQPIAGEVRCNLSQHGPKAVARRGSSMNQIIEVRFEESALQSFAGEVQVPLEIG